MVAERTEPTTFLRTGYDRNDRVGVFLKSSVTGRARQRVMQIDHVLAPPFLEWLHTRNDGPERSNVYVSINTIAPGRRSRRRHDIETVRHVFLDVDANATEVLSKIEGRRDLPVPSYVLSSSPGRLHVLWRVRDFRKHEAESLQRQLALELGGDRAATACSQLTRLPGFHNLKRQPPHRVSVTYTMPERVFIPEDFPVVRSALQSVGVARQRTSTPPWTSRRGRVRAYLSKIAPAVAGEHGNQRTFRLACHLVRGFALTDDEALDALGLWNSQCAPPWTGAELTRILRNARRYGREPMGGLL
jgi:hypothetical protein